MHHGRRGSQVDALGKLLRHPLRQHVLSKYAESVTSPRDVADALGARLNLVSYHTRVLLDAGCLELVRTERRRGAHQHFYRAALRGEIHDEAWEQLPTRLRRSLVRMTIDAGFREAGDALPRGGMDSRHTHMSRSFLTLDAQGRAALASLLTATVASALEIEQASRRRTPASEAPHELIVMSFDHASRP
jgi:DNA-binding transcriptional ArsR family regulator